MYFLFSIRRFIYKLEFLMVHYDNIKYKLSHFLTINVSLFIFWIKFLFDLFLSFYYLLKKNIRSTSIAPFHWIVHAQHFFCFGKKEWEFYPYYNYLGPNISKYTTQDSTQNSWMLSRMVWSLGQTLVHVDRYPKVKLT